MITSLKLIGSAYFLLPNLIAVVLACCDNTNCNGYLFPPVLNWTTPDTGSQGTDIIVTLSGAHFDATGYVSVVIDGVPNGGNDGLSTNFNEITDPWTDTSISITLHIDANARLGAHTIAVQAAGATSPLPFIVTRLGCPPPPQLLAVVPQNGPKLVPGGTLTFRFEGTNLLNNNPEVQIGGSDIHVAPGPYNVQGGGGFDYFLADITADRTAAGAQSVYVTTTVTNCVCTSNLVYITVDASQPPPSPTPGGTPSLNRVTPRHISRFARQFTDVLIKFEGTGFGATHEILVDSNSTISGFGTLNSYQSDPDQVVVGFPSMNLPTGPNPYVTVRVHNLVNGTVSNPQILYLDDPVATAPVVAANFCADFHRGDSVGNLYIEGENLQDITPQSFSGVPGLTFSNIRSTTPIYGEGSEAFYIEVHSDMSAPISGDEATNLVITTADGQSNPFWIQILPPR
jgi:hypothetical protein